jgi:hypothetical protein
MKDDCHAFAAGKVNGVEFKALQAAYPCRGGGTSKRGKHRSNKKRIERKVQAVVLKAQEEAAAVATAPTANTPPTSPVTACVPPVQQVIVQPPDGSTHQFDGGVSIGKFTIAPQGM